MVVAFDSTLPAQRVKFDPRARICTFLGYPTGTKGYKLYNIQIKQVFISRNVVFHEETFHFHSVTPQEHLVDPFPHIVLPVPVDDTHLPSSVVLADNNSHRPTPTQPHQILPILKSSRTIKTPSYLLRLSL